MSFVSRGQTIFQQVDYLSEEQFYYSLKQCLFLQKSPENIFKDLISKSPKRIFKKDEYIYHKNEFGHSLFVIVSGAVGFSNDITVKDPNQLNIMEHSGDYFGEDVIVGDIKRTMSCIVVSQELVCIELEKSRLERANILSNGLILDELKNLSEQNQIQVFLSNHPVLNQLSSQALRKLKSKAKLINLERLEDLDLPKIGLSLLCVKQGVLKLIKKNNELESILSYFNTGDLLNLQYILNKVKDNTYIVRSMEFSQIFILDINIDESLPKADQQLIRNFEFLPKDRLDAVKSNSTVMGFVENMVEEGAHQGLSLLTINLDHCVRCGNCVQSCESRHGHSKFTRKGKALVRRKNIEKAGDYQKLLIPSSCRHCTNPECMIGCPTGAIHRAPGGEVDIKDFCIGCGSCANRCPYGNITMVMRDEEEIELGKSELLASKCNLCSGYDEPNCVHNCPTGAILRVEPSSYFQELVDVLGQGAVQNHLKKNATENMIPKDVYILPIISILLVVLGGILSYSYYTIIWNGIGFYCGIISAIFMFLSISIAVRRRMAGLKKQIGSLRFWTNAHLYFGMLSFIFMLFHTNGSMGRGLTSLLFYSVFFEIFLGLIGLWLYKMLLPKALSNLELKSQIEDDAIVELQDIGIKISKFTNTTQKDQDAYHKTISLLPSYLKMIRKEYDHNHQMNRIKEILKNNTKSITEIIDLLLSQKEIKCSLMLYQLRRIWLFSHLGMSIVLISFVIIHIALVIKTLI